jgi:hypothetical protein
VQNWYRTFQPFLVNLINGKLYIALYVLAAVAAALCLVWGRQREEDIVYPQSRRPLSSVLPSGAAKARDDGKTDSDRRVRDGVPTVSAFRRACVVIARVFQGIDAKSAADATCVALSQALLRVRRGIDSGVLSCPVVSCRVLACPVVCCDQDRCFSPPSTCCWTAGSAPTRRRMPLGG